MDTVVHGDCHPRFERVRDAFEQAFAAGEEIGAAVAVTVEGEPVLDLWGGAADPEGTRPWRPDTIVNVYSTTKGMTALCAHRLVEEGRLRLDEPVATYWPEFAAAGKERLPVRWLLSHRAGLAAVRPLLPGETLYDWDAMTAALAAETPWWTPGDGHGYHAVTFGWLVGEVVRRITGESLGTYFRRTFAEPLGMDFHIGLPDAEHARAGDMSSIPLPDPDADGVALANVILSDPEGLAARAFLNPPSMADGPNGAAWRRAEIPGANGHGDARGLARIYGALANGGSIDGVHVLGPESIARCHADQAHGPDRVLGVSTRFGLGFMLSQPAERGGAFGPSPRAFGHPGAGGSLGFADPDRHVGFGYVMNRMGPEILLDPRTIRLIDAVYASLG
jgi:CubicO group peptidase (beta-lactamase class C family)